MKRYLLLPTLLALLGAGCLSSNQPTAVQPVVPPTPAPVVQPEPTPVVPSATGTETVPVTPPPAENKPNPTPTPVSTVTVDIKNFAFAPASIKVKKGSKIVFTNRDKVGHTATADNGAFDTGMLAQGKSFTVDTATLAAGSYGYFCRPHPNMKGTIIVE